MLKAIIFDFDGVIADTEPLHLKAFQLTLSDNNIELSDEEYFEKYLAYDDKTFFKELFTDRKFEHDESVVLDFMSQKSVHFNNELRGNILILEGVPQFISEIAGKFPLSIGSGALRSEIVEILNHSGLREYFNIIVSADDVVNCKPDPEVYLKVLEEINQEELGDILARECLVIEDSTSGIKAAHSAGMKCLAITNSYSTNELAQADMVVDTLKNLTVDEIERIF